uniref:Toll-like receptor n=1 Tax=Anadara kagoshimensis TaxID=1390362 RepID=A0A7H0S6D8_9BIVA|nr:toll-like receptor [Anadara sativa]
MALLIILAVIAVATTADGIKGCPQKCQCSKTLTTVNCEGRKLTTVPEGIPEKVEKLYLDHNDILSLEKGNFGQLPNLKKLYLHNNKIAKLGSYAFTGDNFPNLAFLDLRNNKISLIEDNSINRVTKLNDLHLDNNLIQKISTIAFNGSKAVTYLQLDGNELTSIPPLGQLQGLQQLYLEANAITNATFPSEYSELRTLAHIGLSNNKITRLEPNAFVSLKQSPVRKLELSRNLIGTISRQAFSPLNDIKSLKIGHNPLTALDLEDALFGLQGKPLDSLNIANITLGGLLPNTTFMMLRNTTIKDLIMPNNKIHRIPERGFADIAKLVVLDLSASQITFVSDTAFDGLKALTNLLLNDNLLTNVPKNLPSTLQFLYLNGNQLTQIPNLIFSNLSNLRRLYLGGNKINRLMENSFVGLTSLSILHLVSNNIATLPGQLFSSMVRLVSLELNKNNLKTIQKHPDLFSAMTSLEYLNMADNECSNIPLELFKPLTALAYLHLQNNEFGSIMDQDNNGVLFESLSKLVTLDLTNNAITKIPDASFKNLNNLKNLTLRANKISSWGQHLFSMTKNLANLDLSQNLISLVKPASVQDLKPPITLNLTGNPFACTCDLRWFRDWMNSTSVRLLNRESYICNSPKAWRGKLLLSFDKTKINCVVYTVYEIIFAAVGSVILVAIVTTIMYRKRWTLKLGLYKINRRMKRKIRRKNGDEYEQLVGENKKYDAYISCSEDDFNWVKNNVLPEIDDGYYGDDPFGGVYKLYFEPRDSEAGRSHVGNIVDNMEASRLVILIISNNYLPNARCIFEVDYMLHCKYNGVIEDFVIVKHADVEPRNLPKLLHNRIKEGKFKEWADNEDAKQALKLYLQDKLEYKQPNPNEDV